MKMFQYFFECYFTEVCGFEELDELIAWVKGFESKISQIQFISELEKIIANDSYGKASRIIEKYGGRIFNLEETKALTIYIYNKMLNIPTNVKANDFAGKFDEKDLLEWDLSLPTDALTYFFRLYFNGIHRYEDLDDSIESFKKAEEKVHVEEIISQLDSLIKKNSYKKALKLIRKYSKRRPSVKKTAKLIKFLYDRFNNIPTEVQPADFKGR